MVSRIIYASEYGASKRYAQELSRRTGIEIQSYETITENLADDSIVYVGGLYAGSVSGLKKVMGYLSDVKNIIVVSVGLVEPGNQENVDNIQEIAKKQLSSDDYEKIKFFHLQGAIHYETLKFKHKMMLSVVYKAIKNKPEADIGVAEKAIKNAYKRTLDFVDFKSLEPIIAYIYPDQPKTI